MQTGGELLYWKVRFFSLCAAHDVGDAAVVTLGASREHGTSGGAKVRTCSTEETPVTHSQGTYVS